MIQIVHSTVHYHRSVACLVRTRNCSLLSAKSALCRTLETLYRNTFVRPNIKPYRNTKCPIATDFLKFYVTKKNSLSRQRRIGPLSRHHFHVATQGLPALSKPDRDTAHDRDLVPREHCRDRKPTVATLVAKS